MGSLTRVLKLWDEDLWRAAMTDRGSNEFTTLIGEGIFRFPEDATTLIDDLHGPLVWESDHSADTASDPLDPHITYEVRRI